VGAGARGFVGKVRLCAGVRPQSQLCTTYVAVQGCDIMSALGEVPEECGSMGMRVPGLRTKSFSGPQTSSKQDLQRLIL